LKSRDQEGGLKTRLYNQKSIINNESNPKGEAVSTYTRANGRVRGVLIGAEGMEAIDFPNTQFVIATGLNARGDIVGWYRDLGGFDHGFLIRR
jgi:hypothetical protein